MLNRARTTILLAPLLALAACGSSSSGHTDGQALEDCLGHTNIVKSISTRKDDLDAIAMDAGDLGMYVDFGKNSANVVVERSSDDVARSKKAYEIFGGTDSNVKVNGNVIVAFDKSPTDEEASAVTDCE